MRHIQTEVLVIGGGATGTGVVRDLAMRGFHTVLVERKDLTHGTTGRFHGLLHSGGRYAVKDPLAARECIEENRILRSIMPQCLEDTGGFFVITPWDDPDYADQFHQGCMNAGIPLEEVTTRQMLREEPLLNPSISRCLRVPDASADSFLAAHLNATSARQYGAEILTYHEVTGLIRNKGAVVGAQCRDLVKDEVVHIHADMVVNAAGAWAGKIASMVDIQIDMVPGKGTMLAVNHRVVNTVVNRCRMPSDGDLLVPAHTVAVMGTTDIKVSDPDHFAIEPWEIRLMLEEGEKILPGFKDLRILRAWAGVRPLYQETELTENRDMSRSFIILDHEERDGLGGLVTITGGKWTTFRKMAESTVDKVCEILGISRPCRTHLESLPAATDQVTHKSVTGQSAQRIASKPAYHVLGSRLAKVERDQSYGQLICECELATYADVARAIVEGEARTIDDVRRDVRLGMGPCQGGFCTYRVTGMLHQLRYPPVGETNLSLRDFLQERWKGLLPILWVDQLRQIRFNELIFLNVLNVDHLPGVMKSRLSSDNYDPPIQTGYPGIPKQGEDTKGENNLATNNATSMPPSFIGQKDPRMADVLVIGAGLAGLISAWQTAAHGKKTRLITKGWGGTHWGTGCIDILGYHPIESDQPVEDLVGSIMELARANPRHPYSIIGMEYMAAALVALKKLCVEADYPLHGSLERNWLLPSAMGALRPTCLAPETMTAGDLHKRDPMLIVGFSQFPDFYPGLTADNLNAQGFIANHVTLDLPSLHARRFTNGITLARLFDTPEFRDEVANVLQPKLGTISRVGFPAVLGLRNALTALRELEARLGCQVFEIPGLPPSIPGIRLHNLLVAAIQQNHGQIFEGMEAISTTIAGQDTNLKCINLSPNRKNRLVETVWTEAAARIKPHHSKRFVLATGGILGGGIIGDPKGNTEETIFKLHLSSKYDRSEWFQQDFLDPKGHRIFRMGVPVDSELRPVDTQGNQSYENLYVIGNALGFCDPVRERSHEGIALVTGYAVAQHILKQ